MINAVFEKTMENVRKNKDICVCHSSEIAKSETKRISYWEIVCPETAVVHRSRAQATWMKPIYVGAEILDISKLRIMWMLYDYLKPRVRWRLKLLYTYTDNLILLIRSRDLSAELIKN